MISFICYDCITLIYIDGFISARNLPMNEDFEEEPQRCSKPSIFPSLVSQQSSSLSSSSSCTVIDQKSGLSVHEQNNSQDLNNQFEAPISTLNTLTSANEATETKKQVSEIRHLKRHWSSMSEGMHE